MGTIDGKVVAISGACGRLGSAFSRAIVNAGGSVLMGDVIQDAGIALSGELGRDKSLFLRANLTDPNEIDRFLGEGISKFGKIDAAVHAAYPFSKQWGTRFEDLAPDLLAQDLFMQLGGAILFSQRVMRYFVENGGGHLIHIASIHGVAAPKFEHYQGTSKVTPIEYSAIKPGVIAITRYLAKYFKGKKIRVNCISPGGILSNEPATFLQQYRASCTSKGMLNADDIVGALLFLLSEDSQFINGQNIIIDDGWSL